MPKMSLFFGCLASCVLILLFQVENVACFSSSRSPQIKAKLESALCATPQQGSQERRKAESLERGHHPLMSLNLNLDSLARGGAAPRAQELLERIEALYEEGYYAVSPDIVSYNSVLNAWAKQNAPEKALELLETLKKKSEKISNNEYQNDAGGNSNSDTIQANAISYNTVIYAFAQNGLYKEAEELLRLMQGHEDDGIAPDTVTFNSVLYAYAQSAESEAPSKAESLLREMMTDENQAQVDTTSFNIVLHAWAKSKLHRAPYRAQELLEHMETLSLAGNTKVKPDVYSYTTVIQAWVSHLRHRHIRQESQRRGNRFDKTGSTLGALSKGPTTATARAASTLLKKMEDQQLQPNLVTYTSVMAALCWSGKPQDAHDLLLNLLKRFEQQEAIVRDSPSASAMLLKPDTIAFSAVMDGWVKNSHIPKSTERVMELLKIMKEWEARGHLDMGPNSRTYTSVISALAKSRTWDACVEARNLLREIPDDGASVIHYNAVFDAFAKSPRADKARHAKKLLDEMVADHQAGNAIEPDIISYNSVMSACAGSFGSPELRKESLTTATAIFTHICQSDHLDPSPYTFSVMIKAFRKLVADDDTRYKFVSKVFQLCCRNGKLNAGVWQQVRKTIPMNDANEEVWKTLIGKDRYKPEVQLSDLPQNWKYNSRC